MKRFEILEQLEEFMTSEDILESLVKALSDDEAIENFKYIIQMHDLPIDLD